MPYRECCTAESAVGMQYYLSTENGTGGRIKTFPEDFVVREMSDRPTARMDGKYTIADVTTNNWETNRLVRLLSRGLQISRERIGFAGTKDKRAVTTQLMSFQCPKERLNDIDLKDVRFDNVYTAARPIRIGDLLGNIFDIRVRECAMPTAEISDSLKRTVDLINGIGGFPNYFGVQRFGTARPITHQVGEAIVRGDLPKAIEIYLSAPSDFESDDVISARKMLASCHGDYSKADCELPKTMGFEKALVQHLVKSPDDYAGAIEELPSNLQMMFTHAYQSYLFNLMLSERMRRGIPLNDPIVGDVVIPMDANKVPMHDDGIVTTEKNIDLVRRQVRTGRSLISIIIYGTDSRFAEGEMGEIERSIIEKEKLEEKDFVVPPLPHCSSKGTRREIICPISELSYKCDESGYKMHFALPKGNYATCLMREFMKSDMNSY
jgi:tRNA pseudouridine13 synthase